MAIRLYGDESEDKEEKVLAVAGFIGQADEWDRLEEEWIARVKPTGITAYHMTDCESGWGEFSKERGWTKRERDRLTIDLIEMICRRNIFLLGMGVLLDDYKALPPFNSKGELLGHDRWHSAFQLLVFDAADKVDKQNELPPEETIEFFFDWRMKQGAANDIFSYTKEETKLKSWRNRLGTLTFGHKEFDVPGSIPLLQCADIAAVETRKMLSLPITHPHLPERRSMARLKEAGKIWSVKYLDRPVLVAMYESKREELGLPNSAKEAEERLRGLNPRRRINEG
jgi:hypothetical protein